MVRIEGHKLVHKSIIYLPSLSFLSSPMMLFERRTKRSHSSARCAAPSPRAFVPNHCSAQRRKNAPKCQPRFRFAVFTTCVAHRRRARRAPRLLIAATTKIVSLGKKKRVHGIVIYALTSKTKSGREREDELLHEPLDAHNKLANWVKRPRRGVYIPSPRECLLFLSFIAASNSHTDRSRIVLMRLRFFTLE